MNKKMNKCNFRVTDSSDVKQKRQQCCIKGAVLEDYQSVCDGEENCVLFEIYKRRGVKDE